LFSTLREYIICFLFIEQIIIPLNMKPISNDHLEKNIRAILQI